MHRTGLGDSPLHSHLAHRDYLSNLIQTKSHAHDLIMIMLWSKTVSYLGMPSIARIITLRSLLFFISYLEIHLMLTGSWRKLPLTLHAV